MIGLLGKIFIKDCENYNDAEVRRKYGMLGSIVGIVLNVLLFGFKYFAGFISGSVAIMADAFNNLSDAGSSIITLVGFKFAGMKPDNEHPFGHGRIEYISGFAVAIAIILMGFELAKTSIVKIIHPQPVDTSMVAFIILLASILVKAYMALYNGSYGKKLNSAAMRATATDSHSDVVATSVVLLSMVIMMVTKINVDGICGLLVAAFILFAGYGAAKDTLSPLLGAKPEPEFVQQIKDIVMENKYVVGIHDLIVHDYGPGRLIISLHAEVPGDEDIFELHDAIDNVEAELDKKLGCLSVIHMDPIESNNEVVVNMRKEVEKLVKDIDDELTIHDFRMVAGTTHTNLIFDVVLPQEFSIKDDDVRKMVQDKIQEKYPNHFAVIKIEKAYV